MEWTGLQVAEASWEPAFAMLKNVPAKVSEYLAVCEDDQFKTAMTHQESL